MTTTITLMTLTEFEAFVDQLEQDGVTYEYIAGELFEVPTNQLASKLAAHIRGSSRAGAARHHPPQQRRRAARF